MVSLHEELEKTRGLVARERREVAEQCKRTVDELQSQFQDKTAEVGMTEREITFLYALSPSLLPSPLSCSCQ